MTPAAAALEVAAPAEEIFEPHLPLDRIELSGTNPRKHLTESSIDELAESIKVHGVVQPITVRPNPNREGEWYELVFGERRFRASVKAGKATIPALVRHLDDETMWELQIIENVCREDVHELDEANGYQTLINDHGYDVKRLADRIGKSKEYVYKRLKLAGAIPEIQKLFYSRELTAGHVEQIARLPDVSQRVVLEKGLFKRVRDEEQRAEPLTLAEILGDESRPPAPRAPRVRQEAISVRELDAFIHEYIYSDLGTAIFDVKDPKLLPAAGACGPCPKRFGNACADRACFNRKLNASIDAKVQSKEWIAASADWNKKDLPYFLEMTEAQPGSCKHIQIAVGVDGGVRGQTKTVCISEGCAVHHPKPRWSPSEPAALRPDMRVTERPQRSLLDEDRKQTRAPLMNFDKRGALQHLGDLRKFADRAMDFLEREEVVLALGSAESAFNRAESVRTMIQCAVEELREATKPPKVRETRLDAALRAALHADNARWNSLRKSGATNVVLKAAIGTEFGIAGSSSHPSWHSFRGGSNPRFYLRMDYDGKPTLQGRPLIDKARDLLAIPYPAMLSARPGKISRPAPHKSTLSMRTKPKTAAKKKAS